MAAIGIAPHVIEAVLNHRSGALGGIAGIYNCFEYHDDRRYALELWARRLEEIIRKVRQPAEAPIVVSPSRQLSLG